MLSPWARGTAGPQLDLLERDLDTIAYAQSADHVPTVPVGRDGAKASGRAPSLACVAGPLERLTAAPRFVSTLLATVQSLEREVRLMRAAVEDVRTEVQGVKTSVEPLERQLDELTRSLHPIGRLTGRLRRSEGEDTPESA